MSPSDPDRHRMETREAESPSPDFPALFEAAPTPLLVIAPPDWTIVAANAARLKITGTTREEQIGRRLFDVFPDDPNDPDADGVRNLSASLERAIATRAADTMAVQRYALQAPDGTYVERWWAPVNTPVLDENGEVASILHHVEDVTEVVRLRGDAEGRNQFVRSQQVVIDRLGASEAALRESETRRNAALNISQLGTFEWEPASGAVVFDARSREIWGFEADEHLTAERVFGGTHPDDLPRVIAASEAAVASGGHLAIDYRIVLPDGGPRTISCLAGPVLGADGATERMVGVFADVTGRNRAEDALRESEERFRNMADNAPVIMWVTDPTGYCTYLNRRWYEFTGQTPEAAEGLGWLDATHPDDKAHAERVFLESNAARRPFRVEYRLRRADGTYRWAIDAASPRFAADGTYSGYVGSVIDIDERREAEEAARASEARLLALARASSEVLYRMSPDWGEMRSLDGGGFLADANDPTRAWLMNYIPVADQGMVIAAIEHAIADKAPFELEHPVLRADGAVGWTMSRAVPVLDEGGEIAEWFGAAADVTARREAEDRLHELNETLEAQVAERTAERNRLWSMTNLLVATASFDTTIREVNPAWPALLGWTADELVGRPYTEFLHPDDAARSVEWAARLAHGEAVVDLKNRYRCKDGSYRWIAWSIVPESSVFHCVGRDVTAEKKRQADLEDAQEALRQSQKMEAMGQLTGGVAHDFNNLLTPIISSLDMLLRKGVGSERERRLMDAAMQSAERAKVLVQRLLAFARRQPLQPVAVDLSQLVPGMVELFGSTLGPAIDLRVNLAHDLPPAKADPNQLEMALLNLAVNARDAMPNGGKLTIEAARESVLGAHPSGVQPGHYVRLAVQDTGAGMSEGTLKRAVEPFFSTKGVGKGTGLGLSMVHGLAAQLGGGLTIDSAPGQGTKVELWLPVSGEAIGGESTDIAVANKSIGKGTALLVDDEVLVRMGTADMLEELGYDVVEANSAEEALRQLEEGLEPDLLLTDHLMPGMSGAELIQTVRASRPGLPVAIVSGYSEVDGVPADIPRLSKPFRNAELAECLAALSPSASG